MISFYLETQALKRPVYAMWTAYKCPIIIIPITMRNLSTSELSKMLGGAWSECDKVIFLGNTADETWTDEMWENWLNEFDKHCA